MRQRETGMRLGGLAARLIVALIAIAALVPAVASAVHATNDGAELAANFRINAGQPDRRALVAMQNLGEQLERRVPAGAPVYVDEPNEIWWFRLQEMAAMHGVTTVRHREQARFVLRRRVDPALPDGMALDLTEVGR